ncbi:MAG: hypothetical protein ACE5D3_02455 [Candidatus Binatia bacterium]
MPNHWSEGLVPLEACPGAVAWAQTQPDFRTAWQNCKRGDWMLCLIGKTCSKDQRPDFVRAVSDCVETSLGSVPEGEERPAQAIAAARTWADNPTEANRAAATRATSNTFGTFAASCVSAAAFDTAQACVSDPDSAAAHGASAAALAAAAHGASAALVVYANPPVVPAIAAAARANGVREGLSQFADIVRGYFPEYEWR